MYRTREILQLLAIESLFKGLLMKKSIPRIKKVGRVKAAFIEPFRVAMLNNGIDPVLYLRKYRLPVEETIDPHLELPVKPFFYLVNHIATAHKIPDFGMQAAQARRWYEIETMQPLLSEQPNLEALLTTFCHIASGQSNVASFALRQEDGLCRFEYISPAYVPNDIQMELYRVTGMIELIQVFAGNSWRPNTVELMMQNKRIAALNSILDGCELEFSRSGTAVVFPSKLLSRSEKSANAAHPASTHVSSLIENLENEDDLLTPLTAILQSYITEPGLSLEMLADIAGLTPRALQRELKSSSSSFRQLLNDARRDYTLRHLRDPDVTISDIARNLGYRDSSHFTRAFKQWTKMTPSQYRKQLIKS